MKILQSKRAKKKRKEMRVKINEYNQQLKVHLSPNSSKVQEAFHRVDAIAR